jgi:hypothetical protein
MSDKTQRNNIGDRTGPKYKFLEGRVEYEDPSGELPVPVTLNLETKVAFQVKPERSFSVTTPLIKRWLVRYYEKYLYYQNGTLRLAMTEFHLKNNTQICSKWETENEPYPYYKQLSSTCEQAEMWYKAVNDKWEKDNKAKLDKENEKDDKLNRPNSWDERKKLEGKLIQAAIDNYQGLGAVRNPLFRPEEEIEREVTDLLERIRDEKLHVGKGDFLCELVECKYPTDTRLRNELKPLTSCDPVTYMKGYEDYVLAPLGMSIPDPYFSIVSGTYNLGSYVKGWAGDDDSYYRDTSPDFTEYFDHRLDSVYKADNSNIHHKEHFNIIPEKFFAQPTWSNRVIQDEKAEVRNIRGSFFEEFFNQVIAIHKDLLPKFFEALERRKKWAYNQNLGLIHNGQSGDAFFGMANDKETNKRIEEEKELFDPDLQDCEKYLDHYIFGA